MNILYMVSWYYIKQNPLQGGIFHYEQAKALQDYCNMAIYYPYDRTITEQYEKKKEFGLLTYRSKYKLEEKIKNRVYMYRCMKYIVKDFCPDIIHAQVATEAGRFAVVLGKLFHIPVMITEHSSPDLSGVKTFPHYYYAKFAYKGSVFNACVSDYVRDELKKLFPKYEFYTVYNGINILENAHSNQCYKIENKINIVVVAGFYDKYVKGIPKILKSIKKASEIRKDFFVHIIGGGEFLEEFKENGEKMKINDYLHFYGTCSHEKVWEIVSGMDFMVSASMVESFGCAIAEAQMLGIPVLTTDSGGPRSIVSWQTGMLVDRYDETAFYEGFIEMLDKYQTYSRSDIREQAISKFSMNKITKVYYDIYCKILNYSSERE